MIRHFTLACFAGAAIGLIAWVQPGKPDSMGSAPASVPQPAPAAANLPPLLFVVTYTPGVKWQKGLHLLQQPNAMDHGAYWDGQTKTGVLAASGLLDDGLGGELALVQGESIEGVQRLVADDPAVKSGSMKADVRSWRAIAWMGELGFPAAAAHYRTVRDAKPGK